MNSASIFIPVLNEADKIAAAIESVHWADEVLTIDIARGVGCRIETLTFEDRDREDSDLVARPFHAGVLRRPLGGRPVWHQWHQWHQWHPGEDRGRVRGNGQLLQAYLNENRGTPYRQSRNWREQRREQGIRLHHRL